MKEPVDSPTDFANDMPGLSSKSDGSSPSEIATNPFAPPASTLLKQEARNNKAGPVLLSITVIATLMTALHTFQSTLHAGRTMAFAAGGTVGAAVLFPLVIVGFFQLGVSFRNSRSRTKIYFWALVAHYVLTSLPK